MTTTKPGAGRDVLDRLLDAYAHGESGPTDAVLSDAIAEIERLRALPDEIAEAILEASKLSHNAQRPDVIHGMRVAAVIARVGS